MGHYTTIGAKAEAKGSLALCFGGENKNNYLKKKHIISC